MVYTGVDNLEVMLSAKNYNAFVADQIFENLAPLGNYLDFGAGLGIYAHELKKRNRKVLCLEIDPLLVQRLESNGFDVVQSLEEVRSGSLDLIYSVNVLEHIDDDQATLTNCFDCLKPGGQLFLYVPAFQHLYSSMDRKVGHHRRYTRGSLFAKVSKAGFQVSHSRYTDSLGYFASLAYKFMGDKNGDINSETIKFYDRYIFPASRGLDLIFGKTFGKNVLLLAKKPV